MADIDFGALQPLIDDENVFRITVNSPKHIHIWHRDRGLESADIEFADESAVDALAERIAAAINMPLDYQHPILDVRLAHGVRVMLISRYVSSQGTVIHVEKAYNDELTIDKLVKFGALSQNAADFLIACLKAHRKIAFIGGYHSGRISAMNAFALHIPEVAPTVVIEPYSSIHLPNHKNIVKLESQKSSFMNGANLNNNALLDAALRLKPHRLIVADIDGSEVNGLLHAMYNGLDVMFSMSASDTRDTLARLESMATANNLSTPVVLIRRQIAESIDLIVHVDLMNDAFQRMISITSIEDMQGDMVTMKTIFGREHGLTGGDLEATGVIPERTLERIRNSGKDVTVDEAIFEAKA